MAFAQNKGSIASGSLSFECCFLVVHAFTTSADTSIKIKYAFFIVGKIVIST